MNAAPHPEAPPARAAARRWALPAMLAFVAVVHVGWWAVGAADVRHGNLFDSDGYTWLLRVQRLLETGDWFDSTLPRANAPEGGSLHWTRPFDVVLMALALPLMPALGLRAALYWSGVVIGPLLHLAAAAALAWAATPLIGRGAAVVAGALTAAQAAVVGYALVGRADHHLLQALIAVVAFGFAARALASDGAGDGGGNRPALAAGAALASAIWVGVEAQVLAVLVTATMALHWVAAGGAAAARNLRLALGLFGGLAAALLIERGRAGFFAVEYDRVSAVHLAAAALLLAFWMAVAWRRRRGGPEGTAMRLLAVVVGAALALATLRLLFPRVLANPITDFDPEFLAVLERTAELAPVADVWRFLLYVGAAALALPWGVVRLSREWRSGGRWPWLLLVGLSAVYVALAVNWVRWSLFADLFMVVVVADMMVQADAAIERRFAGAARLAAKATALVLIAAGPLAVGAAGVYATKPAAARAMPAVEGDARPCPLQPMARFLAAPPWGDRPRTILASANFGAELLYRTGHRVTATVYHRNSSGIIDGVRMLRGVGDGEVQMLAHRRGVELILLCRHGHQAYARDGDGDDLLYRRLERGAPPQWLEPVALPDGLSQRFTLYRVTAPK